MLHVVADLHIHALRCRARHEKRGDGEPQQRALHARCCRHAPFGQQNGQSPIAAIAAAHTGCGHPDARGRAHRGCRTFTFCLLVRRRAGGPACASVLDATALKTAAGRCGAVRLAVTWLAATAARLLLRCFAALALASSRRLLLSAARQGPRQRLLPARKPWRRLTWTSCCFGQATW